MSSSSQSRTEQGKKFMQMERKGAPWPETFPLFVATTLVIFMGGAVLYWEGVVKKRQEEENYRAGSNEKTTFFDPTSDEEKKLVWTTGEHGKADEIITGGNKKFIAATFTSWLTGTKHTLEKLGLWPGSKKADD